MHPFLNGGKQRFLIIVVDDTRRFARQIGLDPFIFKVAGADLVGRAAHDLLSWQYAVPDEPADLTCDTPSFAAASDMVSRSPFLSEER